MPVPKSAFVEGEIDVGREIEKCFAMLERSHDVTTDVLVEFPCIILFLDEDGLIVFANQFAESVLNIEEPKVLGMAIDQVNPQLGQQIGRLSGLGEKNGNGQFETKIDDNSQSRYIYWRVTEIVPYRKQKLTVIIGFETTELRKANDQISMMKRDLVESRHVQQLMLPKENGIRSNDFDIQVHYEAAGEVGGDLWWYDINKSGLLKFFCGDVTGHGLGSGMVMSALAGSGLAQSFLAEENHRNVDFQTLFPMYHKLLHSLCAGDYWMGLARLQLDSKSKSAQAWFAGAPPFAIFRHGDYQIKRSPGNPLGARDYLVNSTKFAIEPGDLLFHCTDGAFDFKVNKGRSMSFKRLCEVIKECQNQEIETIMSSIRSFIEMHRDQIREKDDQTLVLIRFQGNPDNVQAK